MGGRMNTDDNAAKNGTVIKPRQAWKTPMLRPFDARDAATGIFIGPELIVELS